MVHGFRWFSFLLLVLLVCSRGLPAADSSPTLKAPLAEWLVTGGELRPVNGQLQLIPNDTALALALLPVPPDSPFAILQVEMPVALSRWVPDSSGVYMVIGTDSVGVLRLWAAGYSDAQHRLVWGPIRAPHPQSAPQIYPQKAKAVTLVPLQRSIYIKWVITAEGSRVEINGVPLTLPAGMLPWHITYVGVAVHNGAVTVQRPSVVRMP